MKIPEWRPIPPHMRGTDEDSQDGLAAIWLVGSILLIVVSVLVFFAALLV